MENRARIVFHAGLTQSVTPVNRMHSKILTYSYRTYWEWRVEHTHPAVILSYGKRAGISYGGAHSHRLSHTPSYLPVHVTGLGADPRLPRINAGVVHDSRDILVSIPNLTGTNRTIRTRGSTLSSRTTELSDGDATMRRLRVIKPALHYLSNSNFKSQ